MEGTLKPMGKEPFHHPRVVRAPPSLVWDVPRDPGAATKQQRKPMEISRLETLSFLSLSVQDTAVVAAAGTPQWPVGVEPQLKFHLGWCRDGICSSCSQRCSWEQDQHGWEATTASSQSIPKAWGNIPGSSQTIPP